MYSFFHSNKKRRWELHLVKVLLLIRILCETAEKSWKNFWWPTEKYYKSKHKQFSSVVEFELWSNNNYESI